MALTKVVNGRVVEMSADEEAEFLATQSGPAPSVAKSDAEKVIDALVDENIVPHGKKAALLARVRPA